jgi:hypothetical protein
MINRTVTTSFADVSARKRERAAHLAKVEHVVDDPGQALAGRLRGLHVVLLNRVLRWEKKRGTIKQGFSRGDHLLTNFSDDWMLESGIGDSTRAAAMSEVQLRPPDSNCSENSSRKSPTKKAVFTARPSIICGKLLPRVSWNARLHTKSHSHFCL